MRYWCCFCLRRSIIAILKELPRFCSLITKRARTHTQTLLAWPKTLLFRPFWLVLSALCFTSHIQDTIIAVFDIHCIQSKKYIVKVVCTVRELELNGMWKEWERERELEEEKIKDKILADKLAIETKSLNIYLLNKIEVYYTLNFVCINSITKVLHQW